MVALLVVLTIAALIAVDYFVIERRARPEPVEEIPLPGLVPLSESAGRVPREVFLHPGYTWGRLREDGGLLLGVHPLLLGLVGAPYQLERLPAGARVQKGAPLFRVGKGARRLAVPSPVTGTVAEVNPVVTGETSWEGVESYDGCWLCRMEAQDVEAELPGWFKGERAVEWTAHQYRRIRDFLVEAVAGSEVGRALADGGEVPAGILAQLDDGAWARFQAAILGP